MRWNSPANWSPRFLLWRRLVLESSINSPRIAARQSRNQPKGVLDFRRTGSLVRHRSIIRWIMKSGRLDPGRALSFEHLAIGNGEKLSKGNRILRIKPRHANAERKLVMEINFLV